MTDFPFTTSLFDASFYFCADVNSNKKIVAPLLFFDTAGDQLLVAVVTDKEIITSAEPMAHGQAEELLPAIKKLLAAAKVDINMLKTILVTLGPGSFTGVRVGLTAALGLQFAANFQMGEDNKKDRLQAYGVGSIPAMLLTYLASAPHGDKKNSDRDFLVMAESRRADIFYQTFSWSAKAQKILTVMPQPQMAEKNKLLQTYPRHETITNAIDIKKLLMACKDYHAMDMLTTRLSPLYAREPDAKQLKA